MSNIIDAMPTLDDLLLSHAAGRLPDPLAMLVASHLELAPQSLVAHAGYEALGGAFLEEIDEPACGDPLWQAMAQRLDAAIHDGAHDEAPNAEHAPEHAQEDVQEDNGEAKLRLPDLDEDRDLPLALRQAMGCRLLELSWRHLGRVSMAGLALPCEFDLTTRFLRVDAGASVPRHTHEGLEITLVLRGAFVDGTGYHDRGEVVIADGSIDHRPTATPERECLCLAVMAGGVRMTGLVGRLFNPLLGQI